jgi:chromosome segregation ATPase
LRGELFPEFSEELTEYIETHDPIENPNLTEDNELIRQHYSIVLEYVKELEEKLRNNKRVISKLKTAIEDKEKQKEDNVVFDKSVDSVIKSLKTSINGLKSASVRQQKKITKLEEIIVDKEKELIELRGFRDKTIRLLNEKRD